MNGRGQGSQYIYRRVALTCWRDEDLYIRQAVQTVFCNKFQIKWIPGVDRYAQAVEVDGPDVFDKHWIPKAMYRASKDQAAFAAEVMEGFFIGILKPEKLQGHQQQDAADH